MEKLLKDHYTIIEAAESLSSNDPARKKEIQKDLERIYDQEIYDLSFTFRPMTSSGREYPSRDQARALREFTISREAVSCYADNLKEKTVGLKSKKKGRPKIREEREEQIKKALIKFGGRKYSKGHKIDLIAKELELSPGYLDRHFKHLFR